MDGRFFEDLKHRVGFDGRDVASIVALSDVVAPALSSVAEYFHKWLLRDPGAAAVFTGGEAQIERQFRVFSQWLVDLFCGIYDADYFRKRIDIGRTHVRVGLPQHYMVTAMEVVWQELQSVVLEAGVPEAETRLRSLHKLLMLELAVMLESYQEQRAERVREEERSVAEEQLTRSEHLAQLGQLAALLAHEIKNPLAGISGAIQVLRDGIPPGDHRQPVIREILGQINRLDATVKDLLVYARPRPPEFRPLDLAAMAARVLKLIQDADAMRAVRTTIHADANVPPIAGDAGQIEQLVMNLLFNAAHACKEGGTVRVSVTADGRWVRLVVADTGHGMEPGICARAFEPFFTTKAKGTGLGLTICRKIVDAHGGTIRLHSRVNVGTEAIVELPRAPG